MNLLSKSLTKAFLFGCLTLATLAFPLAADRENPTKPRRWQRTVANFQLPEDHPVRLKLDELFATSRVIRDEETLKEAGFITSPPTHVFHMVLARHPEIEGYFIKLYRDDQLEVGKEYFDWIRRIRGANDIRDFIEKHGLTHLFKVPRKWVYLLPPHHRPEGDQYHPRETILVVEDMHILSSSENRKMWKSEAVTEELLQKLYFINSSLGLWDSANPNNIPWSIDGKVAFVDTQGHHAQLLHSHELLRFLSKPMKGVWASLMKANVKHEKLK